MAESRPYVDSEVGRLRTVMLHRPGPELRRLTPRNNGSLLFDGIPWVARAQEEHDAFAEALRAHDVEVLYVDQLLAEALVDPGARKDITEVLLSDRRWGDTLRRRVAAHLDDLDAERLAATVIAGLAHDELGGGAGLTFQLMDQHDFVLEPLPNTLFTRDSSVWIRDAAAVTSMAMPARLRESAITGTIYRWHPRFAGSSSLYGRDLEPLEGGDVLLLAPGVVAVGVGERTTPAGAERLATRLFSEKTTHTVLAVPIAQQRATMHLDTVCTMVDLDAVVAYPAVADTLMAYRLTRGETGEPRVDGPRPFLEAAAEAMGLERLRVIPTGLDPVTAEREQWDDGNNTLCLAPRLAVAYERNVETNAQLEDAGIEVIRIPGSELGSGRGGPRCMSCPIVRDPLSAG
ncbi:arginine deiminase [Cryptosporangium phraense]|uniref:Arginine deiminase n=1 Tax=Cryptosporangium phraense TaxID=2593070 RepID=A0A545AJB8_9ACTN|nr:arginine deiminase [Cryptosporangium phraense]TQS41408.1 arginine deiminase [Cryptosporangium phraense]